MKVNVQYKGHEVTIDIPDQKLEDLINKRTGWEKPGLGEIFYTVDYDDLIVEFKAEEKDTKLYNNGNMFSSRELAENISRYQALDRKIRKRISEICEPVKWDSTVRKYTIFYNTKTEHILIDELSVVKYGTWTCDTKEHAEKIIKEFNEELTWFFTEFKDRMDG